MVTILTVSNPLVRTVNLLINSGGEEGNRPNGKLISFLIRVRDVDAPISFLGSSRRYGHSGARTFCLTLQVPRDYVSITKGLASTCRAKTMCL